MFIKRKEKKIFLQNENDADYVDFFPKKVDVLIEYATTEEQKNALKELRFLVENLSVSPKAKVIKIDKEINDALDDLKILFVKHKSEEQIQSAIVDIRCQVKEREVYYFK